MSDEFLAKMGKRILDGRKTLNYTQEKTAEFADIQYQTIALAEKGQSELKAKSIVGIAKALNMSTDFLLNGTRTEYDLHLLDKEALELTDKQFNCLKKCYLEFIKLCKEGEI